ncbi:MAG TPA: family 16 glycoside hydrolase, partial [Opitutus sp.]|nr:family 16 glycoside hydrolase [Opitutus sp.]
DFRAPRFDAEGRKTGNARLTAWLNGILIHDNIELPHPTGGSPAGGREQKDVPGPQGFMLQNHGGLLQFRHIWVASETAPR